jgi:hypothetical protein
MNKIKLKLLSIGEQKTFVYGALLFTIALGLMVGRFVFQNCAPYSMLQKG